MLIYNCSREEVIVGLGAPCIKGDWESLSLGNDFEKGGAVLLDEKFYVVELLKFGNCNRLLGRFKRAGYVFGANKLEPRAISKGDRLALVWGR
jgi:hypothetical protein